MQQLSIKSRVRHHFYRGVTLVEMLVALVVVGVLAAIAMPLMGRMISDVRLSAATNDFLNSMNVARAEALKRGRLVTMCRSANAESGAPSCTDGDDWSAGWIVFVESGSNVNVGSSEAADTLILAHGALTTNNSIAATKQTDNNVITFNASGEPIGMANFSMNFNYSDSSAVPRQVCMSRSGRVRVIKDALDCQDY